MKKCMFVEKTACGYYVMIQLRSGKIFKAGPVLIDAEQLYRFAVDNGYTDIFIVAGYVHLGGGKSEVSGHGDPG